MTTQPCHLNGMVNEKHFVTVHQMT